MVPAVETLVWHLCYLVGDSLLALLVSLESIVCCSCSAVERCIYGSGARVYFNSGTRSIASEVSELCQR